MVERRGTVRAVARIEIFEKGGRVERVPLYVSGNVSSGGMFLITQDPLEPETDMNISFTLPGDDREIHAEGKVVWKRRQREGSDRQPGMGVQFMKIDKNDQDRVREFVHLQAEKEEADS